MPRRNPTSAEAASAVEALRSGGWLGLLYATQTNQPMEKKLGFDELKGKRINAADKWDVGDKSWTLHSDN